MVFIWSEWAFKSIQSALRPPSSGYMPQIDLKAHSDQINTILKSPHIWAKQFHKGT